MRFWTIWVALALLVPAQANAVRQRDIAAFNQSADSSSDQDYDFDPNKYAAIVMDARTGEVLYARNPDAVRYPASLTKMMTLYMLFDALDKHKISVRSSMPVSKKAASQPQTNIGLKTGEKLPVDTAIRAVVVRSANDVAVVIAEQLGGSTDRFAQMMTAKAHQLGMRNTIFKNPNGLPDLSQHTSARDMAKLGIALRRDFPEYYDYFAVRQFTWKRVSYYTHNRVMLRYAGADGLKTGYIVASGFNVVTSVRRNGHDVVGAVFGGRTADARDDRMISLIEDAEEELASRGNQIANLQPRNLPDPIPGTSPAKVAGPKPVDDGVQADRGIIQAQNSVQPDQAPDQVPDAAATPEPTQVAVVDAPAQPAPQLQAQTQPQPQPVTAKPVPSKQAAQSKQQAPAKQTQTKQVAAKQVAAKQVAQATPAPQKEQPQPQTVITTKPDVVVSASTGPLVKTPQPMVPAQTAATQPFMTQTQSNATFTTTTAAPTAAAQPQPQIPAVADQQPEPTLVNRWGIQVGAFEDKTQAEQAAQKAYAVASKALKGSRIAVAGSGASGKTIHRARLENITENQARNACQTLISNQSPCFIYRVN